MKVLLLDTSFAATPIYEFLIASGHDVWVMGNRPEDLLARKAGSHWIEQDYSRVDDVDGHVARLGIERVVPGCTDVSIETALCLKAVQGYGDSSTVNRTLTNKDLFRKVCEDIDLPAPRVVSQTLFPTSGTFICKPVDSFSGRGITIFDGSDQRAAADALETAKRSSPTSQALYETFVPGDLHSITGFVENHKLTDSFFVKEGSSVNPFAVDTSYVTRDIPQTAARLLREGLERLCAFLDLKDGLLHTQFILGAAGPSIIEVSRRCPGDLYPLLIEYSTGFRYASKYASYFLGEKFATEANQRRHILRHTVTADQDNILAGLTLEPSRAVRAFYPIVSMGASLLARQGNRAGLLFCEDKSYVDLLKSYQDFLLRKVYRVDRSGPV
jgi:hypothetical protein